VPFDFGRGTDARVPRDAGLAVRFLADAINARHTAAASGIGLTLTLQYVQIYQERTECLLSSRSVRVLPGADSATHSRLSGAESREVGSLAAALEVLRDGNRKKARAATKMNARSSRAHTVLCLNICQSRDANGRALLSRSALYVVDLAGSERVKRSGATGVRMSEAIEINSSLLSLGQVISALVEEKPHVPYMNSKLTKLLSGALGGASVTTCVVATRTEDSYGDETLQSLRFGERCARVFNRRRTGGITNATEALAQIDAAIESCNEQVAGMEERGKGTLQSCIRLRVRCRGLASRRQEP